MGVIRWYKRLRHAAGFGVHSPYAYRLVREVLAPSRSVGLYAYAEVRSREGRLICRLAVEFKPQKVAFSGKMTIFADALKKIAPSAEIVLNPDGEDCIKFDETARYYGDVALAQREFETIKFGHLYLNPSRALMVLNRKLPHQTIEIRF